SGQIELPPGDVAQGILAASRFSAIDKEVYRHRDEVGQSLINRVLVAYINQFGSFHEGVNACARHFQCQGKVLTITNNQTILMAHTEDGQVLVGEHVIDEYNGRIQDLELIGAKEQPVTANPDVLEAILSADVLVFGPGSMF